MNIQDTDTQILKDTGKPLHAKEIAERIIEADLWSNNGKTPKVTVSARLHSDTKKHGTSIVFFEDGYYLFFGKSLAFHGGSPYA